MLRDLHDRFGQSFWYDDLSRDLLESGRLAALVEDAGLRGVTSNPTTFEKAISGQHAYDLDIARFTAGRSAEDAAIELMLADVATAASLLHPVFVASDGADGFVSLEMDPGIAHDADATTAMARALFARLGRPNVMIKLPATLAGIDALESLIATGVNVNVTLLFSVERYEAIAQAYLRGLERRAGDLSRGSASVASFFLSRVDAKIDPLLPPDSELRGETAIANAKLAYARFRKVFAGPRWDALAARGARVQRPLWASTGVKDPAYPKTKYFHPLIAPDTVTTMPEDLVAALLDQGIGDAVTIDDRMEHAMHVVRNVPDLEIHAEELLEEGLVKFQDAWHGVVRAVAARSLRRAG
jgi:transaldolase